MHSTPRQYIDAAPSDRFPMTEFLTTYGLWAAFLLAVLENDVAFIAIGVVAKLGDGNPNTPDLNLLTAIPAAIAGALLHDSCWFALGHFNSKWIKSSKVYQRVGPAVERLANRFGVWQIFFARFIYGTRNPSSVFWGIHKLAYPRFVAVELLGLLIWGNILLAIAYNCTGWAMGLIGSVEKRNHPRMLITTIIVAFLIIAIVRWINRRRIYRSQTAVLPMGVEPKSEISSGE
ncbi:MAG: associated Golgi protein-related protein [Chthoniobacteraceae bacterium]|nr:associated Golgi protein-related protein [Chthoniobacteraceae bacterium]